MVEPYDKTLLDMSKDESLEWVEKVTVSAAKVANMLERWKTESGWVLIDPQLEWVVAKDTILSQGKNTPLLGQTLIGKTERVFVV